MCLVSAHHLLPSVSRAMATTLATMRAFAVIALRMREHHSPCRLASPASIDCARVPASSGRPVCAGCKWNRPARCAYRQFSRSAVAGVLCPLLSTISVDGHPQLMHTVVLAESDLKDDGADPKFSPDKPSGVPSNTRMRRAPLAKPSAFPRAPPADRTRSSPKQFTSTVAKSRDERATQIARPR